MKFNLIFLNIFFMRASLQARGLPLMQGRPVK